MITRKPKPLASYKSLSDFYQARHLRFGEGESDFGCWWRWSSRWSGPRYRVTHVHSTGEIYVVQHGGRRDGQVEVFGMGERETVERILTGWASRCEQPRSLLWFVSRLEATGMHFYPDRTRPSLLAA